MKILVADDSKTSLTLITESLKQLGHDVKAASEGQQAIDMFKAERPDLIILDVVMEGMNGFEIARRVRAINSEDWIPIIFLSSAVDDEHIAKGIDAGGDDYLAKPFSSVTLSAKIKAMQRISDMRQKLFEMTEKLRVLSATDALTGMYNRLQFDRIIKEKISHAKRNKKILALLFLDLDKFKAVNDNFGHYVGDFLLKEVSERLQRCLRLEDFIARIGGDEFAVILSDIDPCEQAGDVAQKIIDELGPSYYLANSNVHIGTSIGIACFNPLIDASIEPETLIQHADLAMYHAKNTGRNSYRYFTDELNNKNKQQADMQKEFKFALEKNELHLTYQPVFNLKTNKIIQIEALLHWEHPTFGVIPSDVIIPIAEEIGMTNQIGDWALRSIAAQITQWTLAGYTNLKVSINVSTQQLLQKNLAGMLKTILDHHHVRAELIEIEITETSAFVYSEKSENILNSIHQAGITISLDDFGMGYSSLNDIKRLPISTIKINKTFIRDVIADPQNAIIVKSIIALGLNLGFNVIAEGIETDKEVQFLVENNCFLGQGSYLSKPLNSEELIPFLEDINKNQDKETSK